MIVAKRIGQILITLRVLTPAPVDQLPSMRKRGYVEVFGQWQSEPDP